MIALILSLFLSLPAIDAAPVIEQGQLSSEFVHDVQTDADDSGPEDQKDLPADNQEADPDPKDQEDLPVEEEEADPDPEDQEDPPADEEEADPDPEDQEDPLAEEEEADPDLEDQEDPPANPKLEKEVKEYQHITIYQSESVQADPAASDDLDYAEESYYLLVMIASVLLFFLIVTICKLAYRFFDIFI